MTFPKVALAAEIARLAGRNILVGTSSWKYPGWRGLLYDSDRYNFRGKFAISRFERECLEEYARVFKTVCVDAGYYQFPTPSFLAKICAQVPDDFRFSFKVTEEVTVRRFPNLPRSGARAGLSNPGYLRPEVFMENFLRPCTEFRSKIGLLIFEFSQFSPQDYLRGRDFVLDLDRFLEELPRDWEYGVEVRNPSFLQAEYFQVLEKHGVVHVMNNWSRMPSVWQQMQIPDLAECPGFAARFLLKPGRTYAEAVSAFSPYSATREIDLDARGALQRLMTFSPRRRSYLYVNNRLEGNALLTIIQAIAALDSSMLIAPGNNVEFTGDGAVEPASDLSATLELDFSGSADGLPETEKPPGTKVI